MTSEQYRTYLTESIKTGAQMMYDMAEDIAGKSDFISNLTVTIKFDPEMGSIPELTIKRSHLRIIFWILWSLGFAIQLFLFLNNFLIKSN